MKKIVIKQIPYREERYETLGDYWMDKKGVMQVRVSGKNRFEFYCYLIHELVEAFLTRERGIDWDKITKFDIDTGLIDPGHSKKAPYHSEHEFANKIERQLLKELKK